jgi:hypothetical protein
VVGEAAGIEDAAHEAYTHPVRIAVAAEAMAAWRTTTTSGRRKACTRADKDCSVDTVDEAVQIHVETLMARVVMRKYYLPSDFSTGRGRTEDASTRDAYQTNTMSRLY